MKILKIGRLTLLTGVLGIGLVSSPGLLAQALTPDQLTIRIEETSRALQDIQKDLKRMNTLIDNRAMLDIFQRVDELADEISQLRGELELQASELAGIKSRQRELYLDIDRRMRDLEDRAAGQSTTLAPVPVPATGTRSTSSGQAPASSSTTGTSSTTQVVPATQPSANLSEEKAAYQVAFDSLKEGRYKQAKQQFSQFLKDYPGSVYAGNAQYWLGEAHYVTRNFSQGIIEFEKVLNQYRSSNKVPDAMLKLGYTYYELKQFDQSKQILQKLRDVFPKSTAARLAGKRLDRIRKEGH